MRRRAVEIDTNEQGVVLRAAPPGASGGSGDRVPSVLMGWDGVGLMRRRTSSGVLRGGVTSKPQGH